MAEDKLFKDKVKSLLLKGFMKEEIMQLLQLDSNKEKAVDAAIKEFETSDISKSSIDYYSEMQKDLSKLIFTEMNKKESKDSSIILQAIKLQSELQEKKIIIDKGSAFKTSKLSKQYSYDTYEEMAKLRDNGMTVPEIAARYGYGNLTIERALDIVDLNLPEELKTLNPTIIQETRGLLTDIRIKLLWDAVHNNYTKGRMREIVNRLKEEGMSKKNGKKR
jgi:hypothetical protein